MLIKVEDLTLVQLDRVILKLETQFRDFCGGELQKEWADQFGSVDIHTPFTSDWALGGPIVERAFITTEYSRTPELWQATCKANGKEVICVGPTTLIATMRAYVAAYVGDKVDVSDTPDV